MGFQGFHKWGYPQIIYSSRILTCKTIHVGVPPFMKTPKDGQTGAISTATTCSKDFKGVHSLV